MRRVVVVLSVLLWSVPVSAQMHIEVQADRVVIGSEFVPRFLDGAVLQVKAGESVVLPANSTWDTIEVAGTLFVSRTADTMVRFTNLIILPGGVLDCGTPANPIPIFRHVEFVVRDQPLSPADTHQWGNGLLNFGHWTCHGAAKTAWTNATADLPAGTTSLSVEQAAGWQVGDALLIPDMAAGTPRRESPLSIAAISGTTITLNKPLDFDHLSIRTPDDVVKRPYVANLTRNIVIRSENPNGTRGHVASVGHTASFDLQYAACLDLGRTTVTPIDPVTNHVGRYSCIHAHHTVGQGSKAIGLSIQRSPKWALTIHGTSDVLVQSNVGVDIAGGCLTTEDGNEYGNVFDRNLCAYTSGATNNHFNAPNFIVENCPGCEGSGGWFRGIQNTYTDNVFVNGVNGMNLMNALTVAGDRFTARVVRSRGNAVVANQRVGMELWGTNVFDLEGRLTWEDLLSAHNFQGIFAGVNSPNSEVGLKNVRLIGNTAVAIATSKVYIARVTIEGGFIGGSPAGIVDGGANTLVVKNVTMQNARNIDMQGGIPGGSSLIENVVHLPYQDGPHQYILFGPSQALSAAELNATPAILFSFYPNVPMQGPRHKVIRHQGVQGEDFTLFAKGQLRSDPISIFGAPPELCGTTQGEAWDRCGIAWHGATLHPSEATTFDGLVNGYARRGVTSPKLHAPLAIITVPSRFVSASAIFPAVILLETGDKTGVGTGIPVAYKGPGDATFGTPFMLTPANSPVGLPEQRGFSAPAANGVHQLKTWRTRTDGSIIPESERVFTYCMPTPCDDTGALPSPAPAGPAPTTDPASAPVRRLPNDHDGPRR